MIARTMSGMARASTIRNRAVPRAAAPGVVFQAARVASGTARAMHRAVASSTMDMVSHSIGATSAHGGKSSGTIRATNRRALSRLSIRLATLMRRAYVDHAEATSRPSMIAQARSTPARGRGRGGTRSIPIAEASTSGGRPLAAVVTAHRRG